MLRGEITGVLVYHRLGIFQNGSKAQFLQPKAKFYSTTNTHYLALQEFEEL